jgi:hypothetical protein
MNNSVVTDSMESSSVNDTGVSAFSAVRVNSMRRSDKWLYDSGASHHMTANKQYIATHKRSSAPVNISLADKGTILARGSGRVNVEMLVEDTWKTCGTFPILEGTCSWYGVRQNTVLDSSKNINGLCFNTTVISWQQTGG